MDYKQKYEQALERGSRLWESDSITRENYEYIFPELKESKDEKIRKDIIYVLANNDLSSVPTKFSDMLDWLEKQGEMKSDINDDILLRFAFYQYDDDTLYLSSVFVEECNRKHGYGTKILKAAEEVAKTFGISKVCLKVETNSWMEEWYKRNGYEYLTSEGKYDWLEKQGEQKQNITNLISDLENYFAATTKEQQKKDWDEIKNWEKKHFNHDRHIEQEPTNKIEPKFNVGDWIVYDGWVCQIIDVTDDGYCNNHQGFIPKTREDYMRLWTIQDAKDGDVLATKDGDICIFNGSITEDGYPFAHCGLTKYGFKVYDDTLPLTFNNIYPTTKEQRNLLVEKMKEAGYEFDFEKKELKKIEQKPAWSEEDEKMIDTIIYDLERHGGKEDSSYSAEVNWLKSLRSQKHTKHIDAEKLKNEIDKRIKKT